MENIGLAILCMFLFLALRGGYLMYRSSQVKSVADRLGGIFVQRSNALMREVSKFSLTRSGRSKECLDCIEGDFDGIRFLLFEYRYRAYNGNTYVPYSQTVALLSPNNFWFPPFEVKPRSLVDKMARGLLLDPPILISSEFDKKFAVTAVDPNAVGKLFSPEAIACLMRKCGPALSSSILSSGYAIEADGEQFLVYAPDKTVTPALLEYFLEDSIELMRLFQASSASDPSESKSSCLTHV